MTNVPEIRFKGFTDAWEQRKLGELAEHFEYGLNAAATDFDGTNKYIRITDIDDDSREFKNDSLTSPNFDLDSADNYTLNEGDILFARTGASVGKTYRYKKTDGLVYYAGFLIRARIKTDYDTDFVFQNTLTSEYDNFIKITSQRSGQPGVNAQEYSGFEIMIPQDKTEQTRIGAFFRTLDTTITLYKRKLDGLKRLKSAYLQQMFPQAGESVPKVRFEGFAEPWQTQKINELVTLTVREVPKPTEPYKRISVRSHAKGTFHQIVDDPNKVAMDNLYVVHENDLIVNITFAWEHAIAIVTKQDHGLLVSHRFPTYVINKSDVNFLRILVTQETFRQKLELISPGGAGRNRVLNKNDFANLELIVPCKDEQTVIGRFFNALDNQITAQTQKLEQLGRLKGAYLQKMFI